MQCLPIKINYVTSLPLRTLDTNLTSWYLGSPHLSVGHTSQCYLNPDIDVSSHSWVDLISFGFEVTGWTIQNLLHFHTKNNVNRNNKSREVMLLLVAGLQGFPFFFFVFGIHFYGDLFWWDRASVFTKRMLWIMSVSHYQMLCIRRSPLCSISPQKAGGLLVDYLYIWSVSFHIEQPGYIRGLSFMCKCVKDFPDSSVNPSLS